MYVSHLFPTTLPHVKQRTGMIIGWAREEGWATARPERMGGGGAHRGAGRGWRGTAADASAAGPRGNGAFGRGPEGGPKSRLLQIRRDLFRRAL